MSGHEHPLGFSCEDIDDRLGDVEAELAQAYHSLVRIHTWLGVGLQRPPEDLWKFADKSYREAGEKVRT